MNLRMLDAPIASLEAEALVLFRHEAGGGTEAAFQAADARTGGVLGAVVQAGDFTGKAAEVLVIQTPTSPVRRVVLAGLGKKGAATLETVRDAAGQAALVLRDLGVPAVVLATPAPADVAWKSESAPSPEAVAQATAEGARLAIFKFETYKKPKEDALRALTDIALLPQAGVTPQDTANGAATAALLASSIDAARELILHPGNVLTPAKLAEEAQIQGTAAGLQVEVLDEKALAAHGFNGILAIGRGSDNPPRLITMRWNGGEAGVKPIVIVGKGVTFDTGGIGIKPPAGMEKMKYDMGGGAATLGILLAVARLKLPLNVIGVIPTVENMPGDNALCPNEVITMYGGLTAELNDTDCEGRVILGDALAYAAKDLNAGAIVDMATLTGAVAVALGRSVYGVMGNHQPLVDRLLAAGNAAGEIGWQLPMFEQYDDAIKSDLADIKNYSGREAGTITAAAFLKAFVGDTPWVHLDIAGAGWTDSEHGYRPKGPTGAPIRTVVELLKNWQPLN